MRIDIRLTAPLQHIHVIYCSLFIFQVKYQGLYDISHLKTKTKTSHNIIQPSHDDTYYPLPRLLQPKLPKWRTKMHMSESKQLSLFTLLRERENVGSEKSGGAESFADDANQRSEE